MTSDQSDREAGVKISGSIGNVQGDIVGGNKVGLDEAKTVQLLKNLGFHNSIKVLLNFLPEYLGVLTAPRQTMTKILLESQSSGDSVLLGATVFGLISVFVSSVLAAAWNIPEKPSIIDITLVVSSFFVWVFVSLLVHAGLKIIRGKGTIDSTVAAMIYATGTVLLSAVPIVGGLSYFYTDTQVTLTYPYLISYGYGDWRNVYFSFYSIDPRKQERFIREEDPGRERTVLAPISTLEPPPEIKGGRGPPDFNPFARRVEQRISVEQSTYEPPKKSLRASIKPNSESLWLGVTASYFLAMYFYMSCLLSVVHKRSAIALFLIALLGPPTALIGALYAVVLWLSHG